MEYILFYMELDTLKRKLRALKKLEVKIRFTNTSMPQGARLIWDEFFSNNNKDVKHPMNELLQLSKAQLKEIIDIYFSMVHFKYYEENGITFDTYYDINLLDLLSLPYNADKDSIKQKFRQLAKEYHPDLGGDIKKFIALMNTYNSLIKK